MDEQLFGLLGIDPKSAKEKAFTRGLLSTIFNAAALSGPQARPTSGVQALGQLGLGAMEAYEGSFDKTLKDAISSLQVKSSLQQLKESQQKQARQDQIKSALALPTLQEQAQALQSLGAYEEIKNLAEGQRALRRIGLGATTGQVDLENPFLPYLKAESPQVRQLAETYSKGFDTGRIDEETADKRLVDLARMEETYSNRVITRETAESAREEKRLEGTEGQKLAAGFASRMESANAVLNQLEQAGGLPTEFTSFAGGVPLIGGYLQRKAMTPEQQRYKQAADNWIRANLRKESGAAIPPEEMQLEYETYFPMPGDTPDVIAQKAEARRITTDAMILNAGPVYRPTAGAKRPKTSPKDVKNKYGLE
jgi:hypothetical protein